MEIKRGSDVVSGEGETVGKLRRVVIDPATKEVAFLVIERGLIFTVDKILPLDFVKDVQDGRVVLSSSREGLDKLDTFEEVQYIPRNEEGEQLEAYYWYPPLHGLSMAPYPVYPHPVYIESSGPNFPENFVALKEGARVMTEDGKHAGNLERIIVDPDTNQATHIVVSSGFLTKESKLLPAYWIKDVSEDEVHLTVESGLFDKLVEYKPED